MTICPDRDCREELMKEIAVEASKHPTTKAVIAIISVPLTILGIIVTLITLIVNISLGNIDQRVTASKDRNIAQDQRIMSLELRDEKLIADMRIITVTMDRVTKVLDRIEAGQ